LAVSGNPITTTGTLAITFDTGYSIPTTSDQTNWSTAYTDRLKWDGGSSGLTASTGRTSLGATTIGSNLFTLTNPSAVTFPRFNADDTVSALDATNFRTAIGAGTSSTTGTVTSIATTSPITGGTITGSGTIGINASSTNTASYVVQRDASGNFSAGTITASLTGTASSATNLAGGGAGQVPYNTGSGATSFLAAGTSGQVLTSNGSSAPTWGNVLPSGVIQMFGGSVIPSGWLSCDGSAVSRSTYSALFSAIGTTFGAGNGSTTFNIPDMRGRMGMGTGTGSGLNSSGTGAPSGTAQTARTLGQWGGEETHQLTLSNIPSHSHNGSTGNAGSHTHTFSKEVLTYVGSGGSRYDPYPGSVWTGSPAAGLTLSTAADHSHSISANGSDGRHATIPPFVVLNYIIKT